MFFDQVKIYVKAGDGGDGVVHFRREKFVPRGGPDGGDGGDGGSVILYATFERSTLIDLHAKQHYVLPRGEHGHRSNRSGKSHPDLLVPVPVGTVVLDADTGLKIADLTEPGQQITVASGGRGGIGNTHFKSSTRQVPLIATQGRPGEAKWLQLELKFLADVGLVGFPNAGKSTLISVISSARPKIAPYPFTTLIPNLGVVTRSRGLGRGFTVADMPGLTVGAHQGHGLGIQFLKHIERTALLLHLVDVSEMATEDPVLSFEVIRKELSFYQVDLVKKPFLVAATKIDVAGEGAKADRLRQYCRARKVKFFSISAATGRGIPDLVREMSRRVEASRAC